MSPTHHLTDETLQDYAAGALDAPMETLVACHLTMCARCRARSIFADALGGSLLDEHDASPVRVTAAEVLARAVVEGRTPMSRTAPEPLSGRVDDVPRPLGRLLPTELDGLHWRRVAPGIRQYNLDDRHRRDGAFKLLHLAPGVTLSDHGHNDRELTYVVRGSYTDEMGRFRAGDIADLDDHDSHRPVVDQGRAVHRPHRHPGAGALQRRARAHHAAVRRYLRADAERLAAAPAAAHRASACAAERAATLASGGRPLRARSQAAALAVDPSSR